MKLKIIIFKEFINVIAVSYTHLDVYKRQAHYLAAIKRKGRRFDGRNC